MNLYRINLHITKWVRTINKKYNSQKHTHTHPHILSNHYTFSVLSLVDNFLWFYYASINNGCTKSKAELTHKTSCNTVTPMQLPTDCSARFRLLFSCFALPHVLPALRLSQERLRSTSVFHFSLRPLVHLAATNINLAHNDVASWNRLSPTNYPFLNVDMILQGLTA